MAAGNRWDIEEITVALALYLSRPLRTIDTRNQYVQAVARILNRTPGSVALKVANLAYFDPDQKAKGMSNGSVRDREVLQTYLGERSNMEPISRVFDEAQRIAETRFHADLTFLVDYEPKGPTDRMVERRERLLSDYFRAAVLSNFNGQCAVTGLKVTQLIEAAHILPWAKREDLRLVPANGIALCSLLHRAYDAELMGIDASGLVHISPRLLKGAQKSRFETFFAELDGRVRLRKADRFTVDPELLDEKYKTFLEVERHGGNDAAAEAYIADLQ